MKAKDISKLSYIEFMALIEETNRAPGGKDSLRRISLNTFLNDKSKVLHIGCNTGSSTRQLVRFTRCQATGIDLSESMIKVARKATKEEKLDKYVKFRVGDARRLRFGSGSFDLVLSPGSIAFMDNKDLVFNEMLRILRYYGYFVDIPMYYVSPPPDKLINQLNREMDTKIEKWNLEYWKKLYDHPHLELVYEFEGKLKVPSQFEIKLYTAKMVNDLNVSLGLKNAIRRRLTKTMILFSKNHKYLSYSILIYQKVYRREQIDLFGP